MNILKFKNKKNCHSREDGLPTCLVRGQGNPGDFAKLCDLARSRHPTVLLGGRKPIDNSINVFIMSIETRYKLTENFHRGFSLVEMLVYLGIMTVITITLVQSFIVVLKSNKVSFADSVLRNSGYLIMENIIREVRSSKDISQCNSGVIQLNQDTNNISFSISNGLLKLIEGSVDKGFLNSKGTEVTSLSCSSINTGKTKAVKIKLTLSTEIGGQEKSESFYSTVILRGSY